MSENDAYGSIERSLKNQIGDVYQSESFAVRHCRHEAERLGSTSPAAALLAIGAHAEATRGALLFVAARDGLRASLGGAVTGLWLLSLRDIITDLLVEDERSYRATLAGVSHSVELMRRVSSSARAASRTRLAEFSAAWLATRIALLERAEAQLQWFPRNVEKGAEQRWLSERYGLVEPGPALHPWSRETGLKGASNVGEDETSGSE